MMREIRKSFYSILVGIFGFCLLSANFVVGRPEGKLFPVIDNYEIQSATLLKNGYVRYDVTFNKARDCEAQGGGIFYQVGKYHIRALIRRDADNPLVSRPVGWQRGVWEIAVPPEYYGVPLEIVAKHKCFGPLGWTTTTDTTTQFTGPLVMEGYQP